MVIRSRNWPLADRDRPWDGNEAVQRIRAWAGGDEVDFAKYKTCFLWFDEDNPETLGAYKFPYVDIIGDGPKVVFRALAAIIAAINGARGGTNLSDEDRQAVYEEAAKQYRRFDEEPPAFQRASEVEEARGKVEHRSVRFEVLSVEQMAGVGPVIKGYAAVFGALSVPLYGFRERILPGAFRDSIQGGADVRALWNHNTDYVLGRTKNGTLRLQEDDKGLYIEIVLPETQFAKDFRALIAGGYVDQMSFGFIVPKGGDRFVSENGETIRELVKVELLEVSPVAFPAYPQTSVTARQRMGLLGALEEVLQKHERGDALSAKDKEIAKDVYRILRSIPGVQADEGVGQVPMQVVRRTLDLLNKIIGG
jgi:HK97 family phage prohead protease